MSYEPNRQLPTVLDYLPTAIQDNLVKNAVDAYRPALVTFLTDRPNYAKRLISIGTGFFIFSPDPTVVRIMTAWHVFNDLQRVNTRYLTVDTKLLPVSDIGRWYLDEPNDVAIWEIESNLFLENGISGLITLPIANSDALIPTASFVLLGYPATKNVAIDLRPNGDTDRAIFGMALHNFRYDKDKNEISFYFDPRKVVTEAWAPPMTTAPHLKGMSGCPCMRFVVHKAEQRLGLCLSGVFTHWIKREKRLRIYQFGDPWLEVLNP